MKKSTEKNWEHLKKFLKFLLKDCNNWVYNAWVNWMNCHKLNTESDDEYFCRSKKLQIQIKENVKNSHHIQLMIFFKKMNSIMK